ncbi:hypothetical protein [Streptomyces flavidovirens]|uniref:hypothetical protein n=1 Tax=Streptomyces flavidovirens TaxID=67298 RepID=UPI0036CF6C21
MPEETQTEQQVETESQETETAPEAEATKADPWADPNAARREIEKLRKEAAKYRTKASDLEPLAREAQALKDAQKSDAERLQGQLTAAEERAAKAVRTAVASKVEALASAEFADPEDAAGALDLAAYVDDDGVIDTEGIKSDLADLLKRKPHWGRPDGGPRSPRPDRTQGSSGNNNRTSNDPAAEFAAFMKQGLTRGR